MHTDGPESKRQQEQEKVLAKVTVKKKDLGLTETELSRAHALYVSPALTTGFMLSREYPLD